MAGDAAHQHREARVEDVEPAATLPVVQRREAVLTGDRVAHQGRLRRRAQSGRRGHQVGWLDAEPVGVPGDEPVGGRSGIGPADVEPAEDPPGAAIGAVEPSDGVGGVPDDRRQDRRRAQQRGDAVTTCSRIGTAHGPCIFGVRRVRGKRAATPRSPPRSSPMGRGTSRAATPIDRIRGISACSGAFLPRLPS
jgi:hypothetical protein